MSTEASTTQQISFSTAGVRANVVAGEVSWPGAAQVASIVPLEGVVTYWITPPQVAGDGKTVVFAGMTPGGFITEQAPLFLVTLAGETVTAVPRVTKFVLLAHDGKGTPLATSSVVLPAPLSTTEVASSSRDQHAPVFSQLAVVREASLFDGAPTLIFAAHDDYSGVTEVAVAAHPDGPFTAITSPWRIPVSWYRHSLSVRASDATGRHTTVTLPPVSPGIIPSTVIVVLLWLLGVVGGYMCYRYFATRSRKT